MILESNLDQRFDDLVARVTACDKCARMCGSKRVLNRGCGPLTAPVFVIGEAPGRLGADSSELPFHGDKSGHNFESLLAAVGLSRNDLFITNAALCNPRDAAGNNSTPTRSEVEACSSNLRAQIDLLQPRIVVTLGAVALRATALIDAHDLSLGANVRTSHDWYGRELIPLYHPGQRAMIHRSYLNQLADYQYVAERRSRLGKAARKSNGKASNSSVVLAAALIRRFKSLSYFEFHKLGYLAEYLYAKKHGARLTSAYFVRQKDGPYCVDFHPQRLKAAGCDVMLTGTKGSLRVSASDGGLFGDDAVEDDVVDAVVSEVFDRYGTMSPGRLKTVVYLTQPMRQLLIQERSGVSRFNAPLNFV